MGDQHPRPDTGDDPGAGPDRGSTGLSRRGKVVLIVALVLVLLLVVVLHLIGGGFRGPH